VKSLRAEGIEPELFWYNPNIHPYTEYIARHDCLAGFASNEKLKVRIVDKEKEYGLQLFLNRVFPQTEKNIRCAKCYFLRLEKTASFAQKEGYASFSTTLLISPYQDHDAIKRAGEEASAKYGVEFLYRDFRPLFREGQSAARAEGMYMQKYCGCIFSEEERYSKKSLTQRRGDAKW
jgi:predicted adenine nucleotide alpha hydrolase (AANH) superfamily ATPase